jgi:hypothetical protein
MATRRPPRGPWNDGRTYHYADELGLTRLGNLIAGSKEVVRARVTGDEPDRSKIGAAGDGLLTAPAVTAFINEIYGSPAPLPEDIVTWQPTRSPSRRR